MMDGRTRIAFSCIPECNWGRLGKIGGILGNLGGLLPGAQALRFLTAPAVSVVLVWLARSRCSEKNTRKDKKELQQHSWSISSTSGRQFVDESIPSKLTVRVGR